MAHQIRKNPYFTALSAAGETIHILAHGLLVPKRAIRELTFPELIDPAEDMFAPPLPPKIAPFPSLKENGSRRRDVEAHRNAAIVQIGR